MWISSSYSQSNSIYAIPTLKMENRQSTSDTQDSSTMNFIDQRAHSSKGRGDPLNRRLKNRERQRRYRARKRKETGTTNSFVVEQTATVPVQVEIQSNGNHNNFVMRDARQAHLAKRQEMNRSIDHSLTVTLTNVLEATCLGVGNKSETMLDREIQYGSSSVVYNETPRTVLCRRDWKAEARRKKN
ncbi:hypothetical protein L195_g012640 [Trifolium pratense]|uniref:BZIP domain-containing protein n=1 Tax=Trifolium pratense TaxID=57577 RepID=A0A2K3PKX0_TRIPR|nr:hypothetical protein L195_g012640 [Trifolium pratense]